jgi:hypothetical protein
MGPVGQESKTEKHSKNQNEKKCEKTSESKENSGIKVQNYKESNAICNGECLVTTAELVRPKNKKNKIKKREKKNYPQ